MSALNQSYVHGASLTPLLGQTVGQLFDRTVSLWPDREALVVRHQNIRWTWHDLKREVDAVGRSAVDGITIVPDLRDPERRRQRQRVARGRSIAVRSHDNDVRELLEAFGENVDSCGEIPVVVAYEDFHS